MKLSHLLLALVTPLFIPALLFAGASSASGTNAVTPKGTMITGKSKTLTCSGPSCSSTASGTNCTLAAKAANRKEAAADWNKNCKAQCDSEGSTPENLAGDDKEGKGSCDKDSSSSSSYGSSLKKSCICS